MEERHKGQTDIFNPETSNDIPIHIIGCGGIGSWSALLLAKMGCQDITVYDFDNVEDHNVASQFYKQSQIGLPKTEMLRANVEEQSGVVVKIGDVKEEKDILNSIVIIAVDSIKERRKLANEMIDGMNLIVDGRMGGLQAEVYVYNDTIMYRNSLPNEDTVEQGRCTEKSISFNCALIGSLIANNVRKIMTDGFISVIGHKDITFLFDTVSVINPNARELKSRE